MPRLGVVLLLLLLLLLKKPSKLDRAEAFRVVDENGTTKPFLPIEKGFVGRLVVDMGRNGIIYCN